MRLVFAGTPEPAAIALRALLQTQHEVVAVLTRPDARSGRGRQLRPSPVAELAAARGIELLKPTTPKDPAFGQRLKELAPDCCPVVAYGGLIPAPVLAIPPQGWVNLHFSLLPAWRGAAPVQHALIAGDEVTGASVFQLEVGLDTGPVFGVMTERVLPDDTAGVLLDRLAHGGADLLVAALEGIATGDLQPIRQSPVGISLAPKLGSADALIDWTHTAVAIDRRIRGCTPAPGAWTTLGADRLKLGPVLVGGPPGLAPGEVSVSKHGVWVGTSTEALELRQVGPPGKQFMAAADWARGARLTSGLRLGESA